MPPSLTKEGIIAAENNIEWVKYYENDIDEWNAKVEAKLQFQHL